MKSWKGIKKVSLFIVLIWIMVFGMAVPSFAQNRPADRMKAPEVKLAVNEVSQHWAKDYIVNLVEQGVINGYEDDSFKANEAVTRAEFTLIATKLFHYSQPGTQTFSDVTVGMWYGSSISAAAEQGFLIGYEGKAYPDDNVTREEAAVMLSRILKMKGNGNLRGFIDDTQVSVWAREGLSAMVEAGYFCGDVQGTIRPKDSMTRGEVAKIFALAAGQTYREAGSYDVGNVEGNVTVVCPDVTLKNGEISGDLYITEGVGSGEITLEQINVKGRTIVLDAKINHSGTDSNLDRKEVPNPNREMSETIDSDPQINNMTQGAEKVMSTEGGVKSGAGGENGKE